MTIPGVQYIDVTTRNAETERHNLATEEEINRSNLANERETNRANLAREKETKRSNQANEQIGWYNAIAMKQHYVRIDNESYRHNLVVERETERSNKAGESINQLNAETRRLEAQLESIDVRTRQLMASNSAIYNRESVQATRYGAILNYTAAQRRNDIDMYRAETDRMEQRSINAYRQRSLDLEHRRVINDNIRTTSQSNLWNQQAVTESSERKRKIWDTGANVVSKVSGEVREWIGIIKPIGGIVNGGN